MDFKQRAKFHRQVYLCKIVYAVMIMVYTVTFFDARVSGKIKQFFFD